MVVRLRSVTQMVNKMPSKKTKKSIRPDADEINKLAREMADNSAPGVVESHTKSEQRRPQENYALNNFTGKNNFPTITESLKKQVDKLQAELDDANSKIAKQSASPLDIDSDVIKGLKAEKLALEAKLAQLSDTITDVSKHNAELLKQSYTLIKPSLIKPFEFHDRADFISKDDPDIIQFAEELRRDGQELPISVRPLLNDPHFKYELVFGCRRHLASLVIADEDPEFLIKAFVEKISDFDAVKKMLVENENRKEIPALVRYINAEKVISAGIMKNAEYAALISISSTSLSTSTLLARFYLDELSVDCPSPELLSIKKVSLVKAIFSQNIEHYNALVSRARAKGLKNHKFLNFILQKDELPSVSLSERFSVSKNSAKNGRFTIPELTKDEAKSLIGYIEEQFL